MDVFAESLPTRPHLRVFGCLELVEVGAGDASSLLRQPKRAAVLAFLFLDQPGDFCPRDRLAAVFWPKADQRRARGALRQSLRFIRETVGKDVVESRGQHAVRIDPDAASCDALVFTRLASRGRNDAALELYRGSLLEGFHVEGSHAFDAWLGERRRRYRTTAAEAAWSLAEGAERRRDPADAAFWGKRALSISPFDEAQVYRLMELLDRVGDRAGALRAYRGLERYLAREFDAEPSPETRALVRRVRERDSVLPPRRHVPGSGRRRRRGDRRRPGSTASAVWNGRDRRSGERRSGADRRRP